MEYDNDSPNTNGIGIGVRNENNDSPNTNGIGIGVRNEKLSPNEKTFEKTSHDKKTYLDKNYPKAKTSMEQTLTILSEAEQQDGIHIHPTITSKETGNKIDIPLKAAIGAGKEAHELDPTKTAVWTLVGLGQLTPEEVDDFVKDNEAKLSYNELLSIKLMKDSLDGDKKAQQIYWGVQEKIAARKAVMAQINVTTGVKPDAVMSKLLDDITKNITNNNTNENVAQEGEIVAE